MHAHDEIEIYVENLNLFCKKKSKKIQASRYFRDAHKSIPVYAHENDATTLRPSRPAAENATLTLRQYALPASPGQRLPTWGSSASMPRSFV